MLKLQAVTKIPHMHAKMPYILCIDNPDFWDSIAIITSCYFTVSENKVFGFVDTHPDDQHALSSVCHDSSSWPVSGWDSLCCARSATNNGFWLEF